MPDFSPLKLPLLFVIAVWLWFSYRTVRALVGVAKSRTGWMKAVVIAGCCVWTVVFAVIPVSAMVFLLICGRADWFFRYSATF